MESNRRLEAQLLSFKSRVKSLEEEKDTLSRRREAAAGENLQLMVDSDELAKKFKTKTAELGRELQLAKDRSAELERECARLRGAVDRHRSREEEREHGGAVGGGEAYGSLVEKNKNLTLWREQLIEKNRMLSEENEKLRVKCQHLEDLMDDEQTDIGDVLELIKNMQHGEGGGSIGGGLGSNKTSPKGKVAVGAAGGVAPISKFRDLRL